MHLVNTIKYLFMSFFEISVCFIIFNNDAISGSTVSTTGTARGGRGKNDRDSLIFFHTVIFEEHLRYSQSLIYKLIPPLPHTPNFYFCMKEDIFYWKLTLAFQWLNSWRWFVGFGHPATITLPRDWTSNPTGVFGSIEKSCYRKSNLHTGVFLFIWNMTCKQ